jgi:tight adherence protein B
MSVEYLLVLSAAVTGVLLAWMLGRLLCMGRIEEARRLERLLKTEDRNFPGGREPLKSRRSGILRKILSAGNSNRLERLSDELYIANTALKAEEFLAIWIVSGLVFPLLVYFFGARLTVVVGLIILGCSLPIVFVKLGNANNMKQFDKQLTDALTIICNSLRAGFSFQTAVDNIAAEMPDPISREFKRVSRETHLGMPLEESLNRLVQRTRNEDLGLIVSAVVIQRQVGGNLAEVLDNISGAIRQRIKLRGEIKTLTSSGKISGYIIGLLPVFLLVFMMIVNPEQIEMFFNTRIGNLLLLISAAMEAIGFFLVRKIVSVKY